MFALNEVRSPTLVELQRWVEELPRSHTREVIDENLALVGWLGEPANALALVEEILGNDRLLAMIAARSYRHVNQFDKIVLVGNDDPNAYRVTLHLWTPPYPQDAREQELIHGHRFHFWSVVLAGTVTSENYARADHGGTMFREYRYTPELRGCQFSDFYEYCGDASLVRSGQYRKVAGDSYYLNASNIHRITLPAELTCTFVLRGPRLQSFSNVFNTKYPEQDTQLPNKMFDAAELESRLRRLIAAIGRRG